MPERMSPPVQDSDIMWLAIKRLTAVAEKMQKLEYDDELQRLMSIADEWFQWAAFNIARRDGVDVPAINDDDVDPFERAALIAETLQVDRRPATGEEIASAIRMWKRLPGAGEAANMNRAARDLAETVSETGEQE